jgi:DNA-binding CsgD family transcriptional regulator
VSDAKRGRKAYEQRAWGDSYAALSGANAAGRLEADDVERLAVAAALSGHESDAIEAFGQLHQLRLAANEPRRAAKAAFWAGMRAFSIGDMARGSGWLATAQRLVDRESQDCLERAYLNLARVSSLIAKGENETARAGAAEAAELGLRQGDKDLLALARTFEGRALIRLRKIAAGLQVLDEAMVTATAPGCSPIVTGLVYCYVIGACQQCYALDRAREWTSVLSSWCEGQPQLAGFAGTCLVHRSEILQLGGAWPEAAEQARQAWIRLSQTRESSAGLACYQEGEMHRLRGEPDLAEEAYARATERGRDPQPGLSLLRLGQGRIDVAAAGIRRAVAGTKDPLLRTRFLPACVEIMIAAGDIEEARRSADELQSLASDYAMELLGAMGQHARGAVLLAEGDAKNAIDPLRSAQEAWQRAGAPYLAARIRVLIARAYEALGDEEGASLERAAARKVFVSVGAAPDLRALDSLPAPAAAAPKSGPAKGAHGLSPRELEVLLLVASGKTNKMIAKALFVSEKTVDRHVSNIFAKLDLPSRAAATAWAYQKGLAG